MREFAPARVCLTPRFAGDLCGRLGLCQVSLSQARVCQGRDCQGRVCQGRVCRGGFVESEPFVEAHVCRKVVFVGVQGFSGGGFLRAAVCRGGGFSGPGVSRVGFLGGPVWPRRPLAGAGGSREVTRDGGLWSSGVSGRTGSAQTGFAGDWVCRGLGLPGTGFAGDWVCRGLGLPGTGFAGDWGLPVGLLMSPDVGAAGLDPATFAL